MFCSRNSVNEFWTSSWIIKVEEEKERNRKRRERGGKEEEDAAAATGDASLSTEGDQPLPHSHAAM